MPARTGTGVWQVTNLVGFDCPWQILPGAGSRRHWRHDAVARARRDRHNPYGRTFRQGRAGQQYNRAQRRCPSGIRTSAIWSAMAARTAPKISPAPTLSNTTAAIRAGNGATDTDNNAADFTPARQTRVQHRHCANRRQHCARQWRGWRRTERQHHDQLQRAGECDRQLVHDLLRHQRRHTATVSGGPTSFTLNPDTDFASNEPVYCDSRRRAGQRPGHR